MSGTLRLTSFAVDDTWPGGRVGLIRLTSPTTTTLQWDNFKVGKDNNANGSIDDGGDYVFTSYDFGGSHLTIDLGYDNNGNLTDDGSVEYRYDGWNRLVRACYSAQDPNDPNQCFAQYSYLADGRRSEKVVTLRGNEAVANDGGNQTVRFLYGSQSPDREGAGQVPWSIFETRNGSNQSTWQYVWGTQYIDEIVFADKNGDPTASNDCNPDVTATGEGSESPADHRYFYHQDRNWNVVVLTDYDSDPNTATNGRVTERYSGDAILFGTDAQGELAIPRATPVAGLLRLPGVILPPPRRPDPPVPQGTSLVLCCTWFDISGIPLGEHCSVRVVTRSGNTCMAKDYEGANDTPPWNAPCVGRPESNDYGVPCNKVCDADRPNEDNHGHGSAVPVPSRVKECLERANGCGAEYFALGSNSNAILALMLYCCGVPAGEGGITFPGTAPGWTGPYGGGGPGGGKPCLDMNPIPLCTRCAECAEIGLPQP